MTTKNFKTHTSDMGLMSTLPVKSRKTAGEFNAGILRTPTISSVSTGRSVTFDTAPLDEADLTEAPSSSEAAITVDGITLNEGASPVSSDTSTTAELVSIIQDAASSIIHEKILNSTLGPQPVILSSIKMPAVNASDMDDAIEVNQFERQFIKEALVMGVDSVSQADPKGLYTAAKNKNKQDLEILNEQINALSYLQTTANIASSGLDVLGLSTQIMERATDNLSQIITPTENANSPLPKNIDEYISLTFPDETVRLGVDSYLTNTSRLIVLAQDMMQAALSAHPTLLQFFSRDQVSSDVLFSTPGSYGYDPDGPGVGEPAVTIPTVLQVFSQNSDSIVDQFVTARRRNASLIRDTNVSEKVLGAGRDGSADEKLDSIVHLITCLSNEMILSAGIGRLIGSSLGNRFIEPNAANVRQYDPFIRLLGFSPVANSSELNKFYTSGPDRAGSYLDYLALGEELPNEKFIVMPFETNTAIYNSVPYVAGKKYFIDLAVQDTTNSNARTSLKRFSDQFSKFTNDMSSYLTSLLFLNTDTKLAPQILLARIIQDFKAALVSLDREESQVNRKSAVSAALFALVGQQPNMITQVYSGDRREMMMFSVSDVLKMSVIKALKDLDKIVSDKSFVLSESKTEYSIGTDAPSADLLLRRSLLSLNLPVISNEDLSPNKTRLLFKKFNENEYLHDESFSGSSNLVNLIARTIREIQKESLNLAQINGAKTDYRNANKNTYMSDCDEDRFVDVVCDIYAKFAYLVFPISINVSRDFIDRKLVVDYTRSSAQVSAALLDAIDTGLISGTDITPDLIQQTTLIDPETEINAGGNNTIICTAADIVSSFARIPRHRYYIKSSLKILESVSAGVAAASSKMSHIFDVLSGNIKKEKLAGSDATLYDMFVTNKARFNSVLENINEQQINLCAAARSIYLSPDSIFLRRDIDTTTAERLALRSFIKTIYSRDSVDDLHLLSVALPANMIDSLYQPAFYLESSDAGQLAAKGNEGFRRGKLIRVEIDRYDNVWHNAETSVSADVFSGLSPYTTQFDPEIFILPDSITFNPENLPPNSSNELDAIFKTTFFYRIRGGKIIEKVLGDQISPSEERVYMNSLKSYLLDLYLYETVRIRYLDGIGAYGPSKMTKEAFDLIKAVSEDENLSKKVLSKKKFASLYSPNTFSLKSGFDLNNEITSRRATIPPSFSISDVRIAAALSSINVLTSVSDVVVQRPFERIYNFLYDESLIRSNIQGDVDGWSAERKKFDIYTLSLRVSYGGEI